MGTVAPARDPADGGHRLQLAERIILSLDVGRGGSRLRSRRRLRPAHLRTGRPRNVAELCRRHAPVAAQWPARAANRYGHEFEIGGAVRVRMHITFRRGRQRGVRHLAPGPTYKTPHSLGTYCAPTISRVRRRAGARNNLATQDTAPSAARRRTFPPQWRRHVCA